MDKPLTVQRLEYSPSVKCIDFLLRLLEKTGLPLGKIEKDSLLKSAMHRAGLNHFGDPHFFRFFDKYIECANRLPMTALGRAVTREGALLGLTNRLRIEQIIHLFPNIEAAPIRRPLFIIGLPRSGTTLLHNLLSLDPETRAPMFWELHTPAPVHPDNQKKDRATRIRIARRTLAAAHWISPETKAMHPISPFTAEECWHLFYSSFSAMNMDLQSGMPELGDWLFNQDFSWVYRQYKRCLQIMAHRAPPAVFILKCPEHLWFLDALLKVFPDAGIVQIHRDPCDCIASYCSMISLNRRMLYGRIEPNEIGQHITERFLTGIRRTMRVRETADPKQFYDLRFEQLTEDLQSVVRAVKAWHGLPHNKESELRMEKWLAEKQKSIKGTHAYSAEMWGLDCDSIREAARIASTGLSLDVNYAAHFRPLQACS